MPRYRIENRVTKKVVEVEAPFAQGMKEPPLLFFSDITSSEVYLITIQRNY